MVRLRKGFLKMSNFDEYLALYDKGAYREAYDVLRDIIAEPRWSKVGNLYLWCASLELEVNNDLSKSRQLLDKAQQLGCKDMVEYHRLHGHLLWRTGEREKGIRELEKSVALEPRTENLITLGVKLTFVDDKRALSIWQRVLEKDPKNCTAHIYIGEELAKSGDRGKAMLLVKRAEKLNPSVVDVFDIGRLYQALKQFQSALNAYQEANRRGYSDKAWIYACIAACYLSLGDEGATRKYVEWAMQFDKENDYVQEVWRKCKEIYGQ
jgi:tetratricopeptide (TPR) repeat protein